jgi:hypothetical protein
MKTTGKTKKRKERKKESRKTQKVPAAGYIHNYMIYRYLKIIA